MLKDLIRSKVDGCKDCEDKEECMGYKVFGHLNKVLDLNEEFSSFDDEDQEVIVNMIEVLRLEKMAELEKDQVN